MHPALRHTYYYSSLLEVFPEFAGADLTEGVHQYTSSVDTSLTDLNVRYYYPTSAGDDSLPGLLMIHGFEETAVSYNEDTFRRIARLGFFVMGVEMRGSSGSGGNSGTRDTGGLEVMDVDDAYEECLENFSVLHRTRVSVHGTSAGGHVAMLLCSRFPDKYQVCIDMFGITDLAAWYTFTTAPRKTSLDSYVGGAPASFPNEYASRDALTSFATNHEGYWYAFHDSEDASVPVANSRLMETAFIAESRTDYTYNESTAASDIRWSHGYPDAFPDLIEAEAIWKSKCKTQAIVTSPASGSYRINGWLKTKRFTIWLGTGNVRTKGKQRCADLTYDYSTDSYTVTPDFETGAAWMEVTIITDTGKYIQQVITAEATLTPIDASADTFLQYIYNIPSAVLVDMNDAATIFKDGSNLMEIVTNKVVSAPNIGQGFTASSTVRPDYIASGQNSLPVIRFAGNPEALNGNALQGGVSMTKFTIIIANAGAGASIGVSDNQRAQLNYSSLNTFLPACNGSNSFGQEADTTAFAIRTLDYDGTLATNTNRLKYYKNGTQQTIDSFTGTIPATVDFATTGLLASIGKVPYANTWLTGDVAFLIFVPGGLSTANRQAIESALRTRYNV